MVDPEVGTTDFGRDAVGNMTSRKVGASATTIYTYDKLNQRKTIDYSGSVPDVTFNYDANGNLDTVVRGGITKDYDYDALDNLTSEKLIIDGRTFQTQYVYDALDHTNTITYPTGRVVTYSQML